jgi:quinoprotein glucose dehydrogenase
VQVTKQGFVFFFDRATGKPLFPVEERPIPTSDVDGEQLWPTQPVPLKPAPVSRQGFTEADITDISPEARAHVKKIFDGCRTGGLFTPVAKRGVLIHPGFRGGPLWGGLAFDPERNRIFVESDEWTNRVILGDAEPNAGFRYSLVDRAPVTDHEGYPAIKPPWGYMTAIDCDSGDFVCES